MRSKCFYLFHSKEAVSDLSRFVWVLVVVLTGLEIKCDPQDRDQRQSRPKPKIFLRPVSSITTLARGLLHYLLQSDFDGVSP